MEQQRIDTEKVRRKKIMHRMIELRKRLGQGEDSAEWVRLAREEKSQRGPRR